MSDMLRGHLAEAETLPLDALPLMLGQPTPTHRACLFLGLLEMVRDQEITADQTKEFAEVWIATTKFASTPTKGRGL